MAERIRTAAIVAPSPVPLRVGGAERHWDGLRRGLEQRGISTDVIKLPVRELTLIDLLDGYQDFRLLDLSHVDLVISGKYPAWMVQHPHHVVWMLHPLRGLYDTYNPAAHEEDRLPAGPTLDMLVSMLDQGPVAGDPLEVIDLARDLADQLGPEATEPGGALALPGPLARRIVHHLDRWALSASRVTKLAAISHVVADRPGYFAAGDDVEVIHPPSCLPDPLEPTGAGDGFLAVGRLDRPKRIDLAISALRRIDDPDARLTIVGDGPDRARLEAMAQADPRISFVGRVDDTRLRAEYLASRAVVVTAEQEDFGYVTIEAMQHGRAVVTTDDSGGPAELATASIDSLVTAATPASLADALARLQDGPALAQRLGEAGRATAQRHSWPAAVDRLLAAPGPTPPPEGSRGRVVAVSTYPLAGWPGGGPQRARSLLAGLAQQGWDVRVVALSPATNDTRSEIADRITQETVVPSDRHAVAEQELRRLTANVSITDIAASQLWPSTPGLVRALRLALRDADIAVAIQPYLVPAVAAIAPDVPIVLDEHNHERSLKAQMLPDDEAGRWMVDRVAEAEGFAGRRAALVVTTTEEDRRALIADHDLDESRVIVVPNGVDVGNVTYTAPAQRAENTPALLASLGAAESATALALFVGSAHKPNVEAAGEVLRIARLLPDVVFVLAGEHSDQIDPGEMGSNVRALGAVDSVRLDELLAGATVALNPMRTGGGSNLKVLTYFAAGVPVVTTPLGARGLEDPETVAVVCDINRFAAAVAKSLVGTDHDRVSEARALVRTEFDWPRIARRFADSVAQVVDAAD